MKVSSHFQANHSSLKITPQSSKASSLEEPKARENKAKFQDALIAKIKELNHKVSTLQSYDKTLYLIQGEIAQLQSLQSQISLQPDDKSLTYRLDTLKNNLKPILAKFHNPLLKLQAPPTFEEVSKNPQKYERLALANQEKAQTLLKEYEEEIEDMFEESVELDKTMLNDMRFKVAHNPHQLTANSLLTQ